MKTIPIVEMDYMAEGTRTFCFAICKRELGKLVSHAVATFKNGVLVRFNATPHILHRKRAIERMAKKYMERSIPQQIS